MITFLIDLFYSGPFVFYLKKNPYVNENSNTDSYKTVKTTHPSEEGI